MTSVPFCTKSQCGWTEITDILDLYLFLFLSIKSVALLFAWKRLTEIAIAISANIISLLEVPFLLLQVVHITQTFSGLNNRVLKEVK